MKIIPFLVIFLTLMGCNHLYHYYDYNPAKQQLNNGVILVELTGTFGEVSVNPDITERKNPYCALVYWTSQNKEMVGSEASIKILKISNEFGLSIALNEVDTGVVKAPDRKYYPKVEHESFFTGGVCGIHIDRHESVIIEGAVIINSRSQSFRVQLKVNYSKGRHNNSFDRIMSV